MFKDTDRQTSLLDVTSTMGESARRRLRSSWADAFIRDVYPILIEVETKFAHLYGTTGQPNWSVARLLGVCILQENQDLTDQQSVDALTFDARWRYALGFEADEDSYLSRQGLVEFRSRIARHDPESELLTEVFDRLTDEALAALGLSTTRQRVDSSLIQSNIRSRGRVDLLLSTLRHAIHAVRKANAQAADKLSPELLRWFGLKEEGRGWFGDAGPRTELKQIGEWLYEVVHSFGDDEVLGTLEAVQLARRVLEEHFEFDPKPDPGGGKPNARARKHAIKVSHATTLQSPHDPDAGQGHKGVGYMLHVAETCDNSGPELITAFKLNPANQADQNQSQPLLQRLRTTSRQPESLFADAGYITPTAIVAAEASGTRLEGPITSSHDLDRVDFSYHEDGRVKACIAGQVPRDHRERSYDDGEGRYPHAFFDVKICDACEHQDRCPVRRKKKEAFLPLVPRLLTRDQRRREQQEDAWWKQYAIRSGIEATFSELKRSHGCRQLRVRRRPRVKMALVFKLMACNVKRWTRAGRAA